MSLIDLNNLQKILDVKDKELSLNQIKKILKDMPHSEIAHALESSPPDQRKLLFSLLETSEEGDVLADVGEEIQQDLISGISNEELSEAVKELELDEVVDILQNLPEERMQSILSKMSLRDRNRIEEGLVYPDDTAGGLLNTDVLSVRPNHTVEVVTRYLREQKELPENTDKIFVVSKEDKYLGEILINKIITSEVSEKIENLISPKAEPILVTESDKDVATIFERNNLISAAVVNNNGELLGRITIDDVVDVIMGDADQNLLGMAGVAEDTFAAPARAARSRILWLSINLLTAFIASSTISIFQATIDQIVYLAILMPIVASMGGVAGTQTLTIMIRGLTLQQINQSNLRWLYKREVAVSIVNGIVLSILVGGITYLWFDDLIIAVLICVAMVTNLICSAVAGIFIPIILRKFNQDPAIAGSVVVTTVTDVIGFFSFLGLATLFLV